MSRPATKTASRVDGWTAPPEAFTLVTDESHPLYDPRIALPLDAALVESIYTYGVLKQIRVVRDGDKLLVQDGRQRVRHALEANRRRRAERLELIEVPYRCFRSREADMSSEAVAANMHMRTPPMMLAEQALRLERAGRSRAQIAVAMGCTATMVENYLRLFDCAPAVQRAVEAGQVPASVARKLAAMPRTEQAVALTEMQAKGAVRGAAAERAVGALRRGQSVPAGNTARRVQNRTAIQALADALAGRELKETGNAVLAVLQWVLRAPGESDQCDDVAECLSEMRDAAKGSDDSAS
jgi:ParB family chromosome partitioning protein